MAPVLLLAMALPLFGQPKSSSRPPRDLHFVRDHWTAYNPPDPATYPAGAKTHTILRGDTLWALAQRYYGNPYLWPQLWEANTWITDAHWIYPGDVLLIEGEATTQAGATATGEASASGQSEIGGSSSFVPTQAADEGLPTVQTAVGGTSVPVPLGTEADLYCYGYIGDPREPMPNHISGFEDVEMRYIPGAVEQTSGGSMDDLVFIEGGSATGVVAGETYLLVQPGAMVYHPRTRDLIGRQFEYAGQVRVLCAEENRSRGVIVQSCREIHVGARLKPLPQLPIPLARIPDLPAFCDPPSGRQSGFIVSAKDAIDAIGVGTLVSMNLGRDDQIQPGDFMTVYRESPAPGQPRQILGEIGVLTTEAQTATGRIVAMRRAMRIGDRVELR